jgi:anaerobic selenocysteine-containing dehydrogenase
MLAGAAAAGCAYLAVVDPNQSSWYPQCPFKAMTGYDCPGCGITRALRAFVTGHPVRALDHNALFVVALVVGVVWFALSRMRERRGQPKLELTHKSWWTAAIGVVIVAFWVGRNVPWGPLGWLGSGASGV